MAWVAILNYRSNFNDKRSNDYLLKPVVGMIHQTSL
jgi:hypothetical protein